MLETLDHYRILGKIGEGAIGELYRARDTRLGRTVALRVIASDIARDPDRLNALLRAARSSLGVSHPNIAELYDVGEHADRHYLASEFVAGQTLRRLIAGGALNARLAVGLASQLADALAEGHAGDLVHGDIRPETIMVTAKGSAKLVDFGLAAWTSATGTDARACDPSADIRSVGEVLFEMLTGRTPGADRALGHVEPRPPRELDPIVAKALSADSDASYQSAATLAADLRSVSAILDRRTAAAPPVAVRPPRQRRRGRAMAWLLALAALGAIGWLVWSVAGRG